jgi:hypothetical protein
MSQLNSLLESANTYKSLQGDSARLASKWAKTGLLEGMGSEQDKNNMSMILENQAKQLVTENTTGGGGSATMTAGTGPAGQWAGVALPLVRKVFGQIAAKEFVSVQPMNLPSGLVFYLDFQYGGTQVNSPAAGQVQKNPFTIGQSLYGTATPANPNPANTGGFGNAAAGGLYGAGRFGYSTQNLVSGAVAVTTYNVGNADFYRDVNADSSFNFTTAAVGALNTTVTNVSKVNFLATVLDANYDRTAIEGFYLQGAGWTNILANGSRQYPAFTKLSSGAYFPTPAAAVSVVPAGDITTDSAGVANAVDLNVAPTATTSAAGVGLTLDLTVVAGAGTTTAVVNNPGNGYVAGDTVTFSAASRPNANVGAAATVYVVTLGATAAGDVRGTDALISFFCVAGSVVAGDAAGTILQTLQPTDNNRGDFEDGNNALNAANTPIAIPEINVQMRSEAIVAKTKKLKAVWTPEFAQDLNAYHSLDAEAELTSIMSEYISLEIDQEILAMLIDGAGAGDEYWSAVNNTAINAGGVITAPAAGALGGLGFFNSQGQWFQTLGTKVQKLSNIIHQRTLRGGANFMVCSPTVATIIESIPGFASNSDGDAAKNSYAFGVQKAGSMNGRYQVYKNPYMTDNTILLGYRGGQFLEAGAVFAPYIPLIMTPLVYDPTTFTPRKGLLTRYAKKMLRPEFYGRIYVSGLNTL